MDVIDFNSGGDMNVIGASEFDKRDERSPNDIFIKNPGDVDEIMKLGNESEFSMNRLISDHVNSEMGDEDGNGDFNVETKLGSIQVDLKDENVARDVGLENLDKVAGPGYSVSHGDSTVEERIFGQKEVEVKIKVDCNNIKPANLFVLLPKLGEKVNPVVNLGGCCQDEGRVMSNVLINNQGTTNNWWDSLYIETATKSTVVEEGGNGDFSDDATTKSWKNGDKIVLNSGVLMPKKRGKENQTEKKGEYFICDLVWGKVRSHPWWPGQILEPASASDKAMKYFKKDSYLIAYFGDQTFAWNDASKILPFGLYFQKMEKKSREEGFRISVDAALDEVSRRVECGLVCGCLPECVLDMVKCQVVNSAGIQVQCSSIDGGASFPAAMSFVPTDLVDYLKSLAKTPKASVSRLQFTTVRAQLMAFKRWKEAIDKFSRSLENDAYPMALHEEELFDEVLELLPGFKMDDAVAGKGISLTKESSFKRKHPTVEGQSKKKPCVTELMPAISSFLSSGENKFREDFDWNMALASSMKKKRNANSEFFREKVRARHLMPTVNNQTASLPRKHVGQVAGKLEKSSSSNSGMNKMGYSSVLSTSNDGKPHTRRSTPQEYPPIEEMLLKMVIVAENPRETCTLLKPIVGFFVNFRNSVCLENSSLLRNEESYNTEDVSELVTGTFEFKGTKDLYWTDRIIENNLEDQIFHEHDNQTGKDNLNIIIAEPEGIDVINLKKDGGMLEYLVSEKATLIDKPRGLDAVNKNTDGEVYASAMLTDADTRSVVQIDENCEEYSPTILILNFNNLQAIPSVKNLNKIFNCYGPLNEMDTEILCKSKRAKIVFKRRCDADAAFSSSGKYSTFGPSLISYRLKYLPKTYKTKKRRKKKHAAVELQDENVTMSSFANCGPDG